MPKITHSCKVSVVRRTIAECAPDFTTMAPVAHLRLKVSEVQGSTWRAIMQGGMRNGRQTHKPSFQRTDPTVGLAHTEAFPPKSAWVDGSSSNFDGSREENSNVDCKTPYPQSAMLKCDWKLFPRTSWGASSLFCMQHGRKAKIWRSCMQNIESWGQFHNTRLKL